MRRTRKHWQVWAAGAIAAAAVGGGALILRLPYFIGEQVTEVVDGDTFFIQNRQPIRLYGLDAPALEYCYGREAKSALQALVENKKVILREPLSDGRGRVMALVYVDGVLVNEILVRNGFGEYRRQAGAETASMKAANDYARENKLGIFSPECLQTVPPDAECALKGNLDDRSGQKEFYSPGCKYYAQVTVEKNKGETWFCSQSQAQKSGFKPAASCL